MPSVRSQPTRVARGMYAGSTVGREKQLLADVPAADQRPQTKGAVLSRGGGGRPIGSRPRPKSLVPGNLTGEMLPLLKKQLSPESYRYIEGVLNKGKPIETKRELDVIIAMLARNLIAALADETTHIEKGFRRDITERLKVVNSMLTLRYQIEKQADDGDKPGESVLFKLVGDRQLLDNSRLGILVGVQPGALVGESNGTQRPADAIRALSNPAVERSLLGPNREQGEADRILDDHSGGGSVLSDNAI